MDFIAVYYNKKNNASGKAIYKRIMNLDENLIRKMCFLL